MNPITPGEILLEEYLKPLHLSQNAVGRALGVSPRAINEFVLGRRAITAEMSIRLGKFFSQSPRFWFNIQTNCDFRKLMKNEKALTARVQPLQQVSNI